MCKHTLEVCVSTLQNLSACAATIQTRVTIKVFRLGISLTYDADSLLFLPKNQQFLPFFFLDERSISRLHFKTSEKPPAAQIKGESCSRMCLCGSSQPNFTHSHSRFPDIWEIFLNFRFYRSGVENIPPITSERPDPHSKISKGRKLKKEKINLCPSLHPADVPCSDFTTCHSKGSQVSSPTSQPPALISNTHTQTHTAFPPNMGANKNLIIARVVRPHKAKEIIPNPFVQ